MVIPETACIDFMWSDEIVLIDFPPSIVDVVRKAIKIGWSRGISKHGPSEHGRYTFKLWGNPWTETTPLLSRFLAATILEELLVVGWRIVASTDLCRSDHDKDVWIFQSCEPKPRAEVLAISLGYSDKMYVMHPPKELLPIVRDVIKQWWPAGLINEPEEKNTGCYKFKLGGTPWSTTNRSIADVGGCSKRLIAKLFANLKGNGWDFYVTSGLSSLPGHDLDTFFFCRSA